MLLRKSCLTVWAVTNIVGAAVFTHLASWAWLEPNLRGEDVARGGDAVVWMFGAFPVLVTAGLLNLAWLGLIERDRRKSGSERPFPVFVVIAAVWISALVVDHLRSAGF